MQRLFLAILVLVGFGLGSPAAAGEKVRVSYLVSNFNDNFLSKIAEAARSANSDTVSVELFDAQDDVIRQNDQAITTLMEKPDAILAIAVETTSVMPMVSACREAGVPLVFVNRNPFRGQTIPEGVYIFAPDTRLEGEYPARYACEKLGGKGNVAIIRGGNHEAAVNRTDGAKRVVAEYPDMKVIAEDSGEWFREPGLRVAENILTTHGDQINAFLCNNDEMALGALLAIDNLGRSEQGIVVTGVDGVPEGLESIQQGRLAATVYQDPVEQGKGAVDFAVRIARGETMPQEAVLKVNLITKDNVDEFIGR
ncbi:MAG: substrate-binding domain-containing protein [Planctomycetes bacterium]|nr:substrate-binding domain-containing protein [Planctomycetota bacterium]